MIHITDLDADPDRSGQDPDPIPDPKANDMAYEAPSPNEGHIQLWAFFNIKSSF
jgi:hypothetical protein